MPDRSTVPTRSVPIRAVLAAAALCAAVAAGPAPVPAGAQTPPQNDPCAGVDTAVEVIGATSARETMGRWSVAICQDAKVVADYTDLGSKGGREAVTPADAPVIGLTALPFDEEDEAALAASERGVVLVPVIATSVACTYWDTYLTDPGQSGKRFPNLRLSRRTLADIFSGSPRDGTNYSPDLAADNAGNPDFVVGPPSMTIEPWMRSGYSAVTHELTRWIAGDPQAATDLVKSSFSGATLPFEEAPVPSGGSPQLISDDVTMKSRMTGALQSLGIGCMDTTTALTDLRPETPEVTTLNLAWLDNAAGEFVRPGADAVTRAVTGMEARADGTFVPDPDLADPAAYPMPMLVYAALPTCGIEPAVRGAMDEIVGYGIGPGQANLPPGAVPLPGPVAETATSQLSRWRALTADVRPCGQTAPTTTTTAGQPPITYPSLPADGGLVGGFDGGFDGGLDGGGVYADPGLLGGDEGDLGVVDDGGGADGGDPAAGDAGDEVAAAGAGDAGDDGPLAPVRRIVAVATGFAALPPLLVLVVAVLLLLGGPALQIAGGRRRAGSLPWSAAAWFQRLRP